jgi:AraC-like DNA-binding protein
MIDCFDFRHRYTEQDIANLNQMHTKQLLKERDRCYSGGCSGNYYTSNSPECKACLANQDYNMTQIAYTVGYENSMYFSRVFKKHTGMSPTEYKNRNKKVSPK